MLARALVTPPTRRSDDVRILGATFVGDEPAVRVRRTPDTSLPGEYAVWAKGRLEPLGRILAEDVTTVTRAVPPSVAQRLVFAKFGRFSGWAIRTPDALGYDVTDVEIPTDLGPAPAWKIGQRGRASSDWAIHVHGRAVTRTETLRGVRVAAERGMPSLVVSYRNDGEAPASAPRRYRLGESEWRDVDAAIGWALAHGAKRVVLFGWSMGGQIALQTARHSSHRAAIAGLVLDSPVVAWRPTLVLQTKLNRVPGVIASVAEAIIASPLAPFVTGDDPIDFTGLDNAVGADDLTEPMLLLHSRDDGYVPPDASRALALARPDIVEYQEWATARHTKLWNLDPERYETAVREFLTRIGAGRTPRRRAGSAAESAQS